MSSWAVVAAILGPFATPGRPRLVIGLRVVRVSWLCAAPACAVLGRAIGIAERFARGCRRRASVARGCRSYLGCRSYNQQSAESGYDCLMHFFVSVDVLRGGEERLAPVPVWKAVSALQQVGSLPLLHSLSRQKGHELSDLMSDDY
jgi:hypothetical protein